MKTKLKAEDVLKTKVFYWYDSFLDERATFGLALDKEGKIRLAVAFCAEQDQFVKKVGRAIVTGRIVSGKGCYSLVSENQVIYNNRENMMLNERFYKAKNFLSMVELAKSGKYDLVKE